MLRAALLRKALLSPSELFEPKLATREELLLAHSEDYVDSFTDGTVDRMIMRRIGFPWSEALVKRSYASVGGAICAAVEALHNGISGNLSGGTHHAMRNGGEGYCVFNDLAVVANLFLGHGWVKRVAIIDLDVHQGNGNSEILGGNPNVFILSLHGAKNYPFRKIPSTIDVDLPDNTNDDDYLFALQYFLPMVFDFKPDIVLYQTGVDALKEDALGRLAMTHNGLERRDEIVMTECWLRGIPLSLALGGGYAKPIEQTVEAYCGTYRMLREVYG